MDGARTRPMPQPAALAGIAALLTAVILAAGSHPVAAGREPTRLQRQLGLMERVIDDMLVESPNYLVEDRHVTEGVERKGKGAAFVFKTSLTGPERDGDVCASIRNFWPWSREEYVFIEGDDDGEDDHQAAEIVIGRGHILVSDGDVVIEKAGKGKLRVRGAEGWRVLDAKACRERQLRKYERAREELLTVLMEYGKSLRALPDGQWVKITARFQDVDWPEDRKVHRLAVQARIDDLRAYGEGQLSEQEMRGRLEVKES